MAFAAYVLSRYVPFIHDVPDAAFTPPRRGLFARILGALIESRQRQAEREISKLLELRGGKLTDETDRFFGTKLPGR